MKQIHNAASLPVAVRCALMPDAHQGYGLPIGGVLATENAVIPYAVGVDIACRMKLSVLDLPADFVDKRIDLLKGALQRETVFGTGGEHRKPQQHDVLDEDWSATPMTKHVFEKATRQLGTSGSGNHFVEFGVLTVGDVDLLDDGAVEALDLRAQTRTDAPNHPMGLAPGRYLALLSHSGSRGPGAMIANHYSTLARKLHPELPDELRYLAWLDLSSGEGMEYWLAMELMGKFAHANHEVIHRNIVRNLGARVIAGVENHHNFAWKEVHDGREVVVHRKGATPAGDGELGMIPGSMASPGFVVRGKGDARSLRSASHGAGRAMSRTAARQKYRWNHIKPMLEASRVTLLSAGIDENPHAYKDIRAVMRAQRELVDIIARFDPRVVRMADEGERPED
jgi:tRNA-splicing ligase RtcB